MRTVTLPALLALALVLPGCLGGQARSEWAFELTQLDALAEAGRTGRGVTVAVLDTGANPEHPALSHLFDGERSNGEVVAFRDDVNGRNGVGNAYDDAGHGSHVLGILAARGSTVGDKLVYGGVDLLGGAPDALYLVAKVCPAPDPDGSSTPCKGSAIPAAIRWAVAQGAQVLSLSLGGEAGTGLFGLAAPSELEGAINDAIRSGVVVVASAGNDGPDNGDVYAPANIPGVLAVGAVTEPGQVWEKSNRGDDDANPCQTLPLVGQRGRCDPDKKPELVAPGVDILSAWTGGSYARASGTSQACPFVSAAVALLLQDRPRLHSAAEVERVKEVLTQTARPVGGQREPHDEAAGYGILQAKAAFDAYRPA